MERRPTGGGAVWDYKGAARAARFLHSLESGPEPGAVAKPKHTAGRRGQSPAQSKQPRGRGGRRRVAPGSGLRVALSPGGAPERFWFPQRLQLCAGRKPSRTPAEPQRLRSDSGSFGCIASSARTFRALIVHFNHPERRQRSSVLPTRTKALPRSARRGARSPGLRCSVRSPLSSEGARRTATWETRSDPRGPGAPSLHPGWCYYSGRPQRC